MIAILYLYFIKTKKEQPINLCQKYFHYFDPYTLIIFHQNQKQTSNKFAQEIFSSIWNLYFIINKKNKQEICERNILITMTPVLIFHQNQKGTSTKFALEMISFLWSLYFIINKRNKQQISIKNIFIPMRPILYLYFIKTKKKQAINLRQKYFHQYDTYPFLIFHQKQKGPSNQFAPEIFSSLWHLYFIINKKEQAINLCQKYFHPYDTCT